MLNDKSFLDQVVRIKNSKESRHGKIRLDKSERTIDFSRKFFKGFLDSLSQEDFIAYPETFLLTERLCICHGVSENNIFLSPGTDAAIKAFFEIAVISGDEVLMTTPAFPMYAVYASLFGAKPIEVSYLPDLKFDYERLYESISEKTALLLLANPNSPIGNYIEQKLIEELVGKAKKYEVPVLIDEAYYEYSPGTSIGLIGKYDNLGVSRTFSKAFGGAGIRVGYVIGSENIIGKLAKWRMMYEINQIGVKFALYLLDHKSEVEEYVRATKAEREKLAELLKTVGYEVLSSHCNWLHFHGGSKNQEIVRVLRDSRILFKSDTNIPFDQRKDWIRLTVGPGLLKTPYMKKILEKKW